MYMLDSFCESTMLSTIDRMSIVLVILGRHKWAIGHEASAGAAGAAADMGGTGTGCIFTSLPGFTSRRSRPPQSQHKQQPSQQPSQQPRQHPSPPKRSRHRVYVRCAGGEEAGRTSIAPGLARAGAAGAWGARDQEATVTRPRARDATHSRRRPGPRKSLRRCRSCWARVRGGRAQRAPRGWHAACRLTSTAAEREAVRSAQSSITLFANDFFVRVLRCIHLLPAPHITISARCWR
jgi:hypothetical protein